MLVSIYHLHDTERARARRLPVTKPQLLVGRDAKCDIIIDDDDQVSPRHLTIAVRASTTALVAEIHVTPLSGATLINNSIISETTEAKLGDTIRIGNTILKFRPDNVVTTTPPPLQRIVGVPDLLDDQPTTPSVAALGPDDAELAPLAPNPPGPPPSRPIMPPRPLPPRNPPPPNFYPTPALPPLQVPPTRHQILSADPDEDRFLQALRTAPSDASTRMVYADWLEQRGFTKHASFVRDETAEVFDPRFFAESNQDWRAITSRASIAFCERKACQGRWDRLAPRPEDDRSRTCQLCQQQIHFCSDLGTLYQLGLRKAPVVLDASLDRVTAHNIYGGNAGEPVDTIRDPED